MDYSSISLFRTCYLIIIAIAIGNAATNSRCPYRLIGDCANEIGSNFENFSAASTQDSSRMIRCCAALRASTNHPSYTTQNVLKEQVKSVSNDVFRNPNDDSIESVNHFASMMQNLPSSISPENFRYPKHPGAMEDLRNFRDTKSDDSEQIGANILQNIQRIVKKTTQLQPSATSGVFDRFQSEQSLDDSTTKTTYEQTRPMNNIAEEIMPPITFLYPESMKINVHSSPVPPGEMEYMQSALANNDENEQYFSDIDQLIDEATSFESMKINTKSRRQRRALRPMSMMNGEMLDNDTQISLDVNNRDITEIPSEFGESVEHRTNTHYGKQSMLSSPPKDLPTTPAVNSFEQKTSSETFLALDRISTQSIDKNTSTANGEYDGASRNNGDAVVFIGKTDLPYFSAENARKNNGQNLARKCVDCAQNKLREETSKKYRELLSVESVASMPRRNDPLQARRRDKPLNVSAAPTVLQKNISKTNNIIEHPEENKNNIIEHPEENKSVKNIEKAGHKNKTAEKQSQNTKPLMSSSSSELKIKGDEKGSTDANATNAAVKMTTAPIWKIRFPPRILPMKFIPRKKERESTSGAKSNLKQYFSGYFHHFYEARKQLRWKIEEKAELERNMTRRRLSLVHWKKYKISEQNATVKNKMENYTSNVKAFNVSETNISADFNGKTSSTSNSSIPNLQTKILASNTKTNNMSEVNNSINFHANSSLNSSMPKSQENILASSNKTLNVSKINSTNSDRNNSSISNSSMTNSQNETSEKAVSDLNKLVSSKAVEKSIQTEPTNNINSTVSLAAKPTLNAIPEEVVQQVDDHHSEESLKSNGKIDDAEASYLTMNRRLK